MKVKGMLLGAGYGSRLAPLTLQVPKPVLPVCGKPILLHILKRMKEAGIERVALNTHHLKEKVEKCVLESEFKDYVQIYYEEEILGTVGPLINAKEFFMDCDCFVYCAGDALSDFDIKRIVKEHMESGAVLTMTMIDGPENCVHVEKGRIVDLLDRLEVPYSVTGKKMTYANLAVFSPEFFKYLPEEVKPVAFSESVLRALREGAKVQAFYPDSDYFWRDIGSFKQYFDTHIQLMLNGIAPGLGIGGKSVIIGKDCKIAPDAKFSGFVSIGDHCEVPAGAHLHNCILLDGAKARTGYSAWEIFGRTFSCHRDQKQLSTLKIFEKEKGAGLRFISLPEQGSDRKFYRVQNAFDESRILMISGPGDKDFERFIRLGEFFHRNDLYTPEIYRSEPEEYTVLMEDLGAEMLYDRCIGADDPTRLKWYQKTLEALVDFQRRGRNAIGKEDVEFRIFTNTLLRWESAYFYENFLCNICGFAFNNEEQAALNTIFDNIAEAAEKMPYAVIHRDFQSQNIMIQNEGIRFVDYQGSRMGPYTYDAASLIKDPYMNLSAEVRKGLYENYYKTLTDHGFKVSPEQFKQDCTIGGLQRNMQALGAYGFLSLKKGKKRYLKFVQPCLELLMEGLADYTSCGAFDIEMLQKICRKAQQVLPERIKLLEGESK